MEAEGTTLTTRSEPYHETAIHAQAKINQADADWLGRGLPADVACPLPVCRHGMDKDADTRLVCGVDIPPLKSGCLSDGKFSF